MAQLDEITAQRDAFKRGCEDLRKQRLNEFMSGFNTITNKLKENYQMLTLGGDAELELVDSLDPFSEGIMFRYRGAGRRAPSASRRYRRFFARLCPDRCGFLGQRATSQEELEEDLQPFRGREDAQLAGAGVRAAPLQAHAALLHGRDRRRAGLQERLHRGLLHLREYELPRSRRHQHEEILHESCINEIHPLNHFTSDRRPMKFSVISVLEMQIIDSFIN